MITRSQQGTRGFRTDARKLWLGKHCVLVAWAGLLAAILLPPTGSGLPLCWFYGATGVPCPGCGLTRSLSCGMRGLFLESWTYHPMGLLILLLFIFTVMQSLLPERFRQLIIGQIDARSALFQRCYLGFVIAFVTFGTVRALERCVELFL